MATSPQPVPNLQFNITPVQMGEQIILQISVADAAGMSLTLFLSQDVARLFSRAIKEGVEKAEVTLVKPVSRIASA